MIDLEPNAARSDRGERTRRISPFPTVLFIDDSFTFGGAIISLARLVKGLDRSRVRAVVASAQPQATLDRLFGEEHPTLGDGPALAQHETLVQRCLGDLPPRSSALGPFVHQADNLDRLARWMLPTTVQYVRLARQQNADLIHLNNGLASQLPGVYAASLLRIPCVVHTRGFPQFSSRLASHAMDRVDRFVAVSTSVRRQLLETGVPPRRVSVIHDAVDVEEYARPRDATCIRRELGIPTDARVFGLIGRIIDWKGVREFVAAAIRVLKDDPDAYALVVGDESDSDPAYYREVRKLAEQSPVGDRILFTGYRDDIPSLIWALDLLVHSSTAPEPFGLVVVEAMAAGRPVIASDRGGPKDIVEEGVTGKLVAPEDTDTLARTISRLLKDRERARAMGERGQEHARQHFGIERYARDVVELYGEISGD